MELGYFIQALISAFFTYILFRYFDKKIFRSLIFIFFALFFLNVLFGLIGNILIVTYGLFKFLWKIPYKRRTNQTFVSLVLRTFISAFLAINLFSFIAKIVLEQPQGNILFKIAVVSFWLSLLILTFEVEKNPKRLR